MTPQVIDLKRHVDDRGDLCELWRLSWELMKTEEMFYDNKRIAYNNLNISQVYTVFDPAPGTIRAYHRHERLWDLFHIASGSAKFVLARGPDEFPSSPMGRIRDSLQHDDIIVTLSQRKPQLLVVPPLWWHGWMSLEPNTLLISIASHEYNPSRPDEERIPFDSFGPWIVEYK